MLCLVVAALFGAAVPAMAVMTNQGIDRPMIQSDNVFGSGPRDNGRILYAPSEADDPTYRAAIAAASGGVVDYYDVRYSTPTLAFLLDNYDCVYTWANYAYFDNVGFGNVLADFVDAGRHVVLGAFCAYTSGNFLSGRIMTSGYCPVTGGSNHFSTAAYAGDGTTCIHTGVTYYDSLYRDYLTLLGPGLVDGHYTDGEIAQAYRPDFRVIYSNGSGAFQLGGMGDWGKLISNSCACSDGPTPTENVTWGHIKSIFQK
jgi:hypothetical protein